MESKGDHLKGSDDTEYKRDLAKAFEQVGRRVPWQQLSDDFLDHRFRFQVLDQSGWEDTLQQLMDRSLA